MKKFYFTIIGLLSLLTGYSQCSEQAFFIEDFTAFGTPDCWEIFQSPNGSNFHVSNGVLQTHQANVINSRYAVSPRVTLGHGQGFLTFDAQGLGGQTTIEVGVVDTNNDVSTYQAIQQLTISSAFETFTVDFSGHTGMGKHFVFLETSTAAFQAVQIDNVIFTPSEVINAWICEGESYDVGDSSYTETGLYLTTLEDIHGMDSIVSTNLVVNELPSVWASTSKDEICRGDSVYLSALGADTFSWEGGLQAGIGFFPQETDTIWVTGTDTATGCSNMDSVVILVNEFDDFSVTGDDTICMGSPFDIELGSSTSGISYQLYNDQDETVGGPIAGDGNPQTFQVAELNETTTYHVVGSGPQGTASSNALHFPGLTTSELTSSVSNTASSALTIEAWVNVEEGGLGSTVGNIPTTAFNNALGLITFQVWGNGDVYFAIGLNGSTTFTQVVATNVVNANEWTHVAGTFNSSSMRIYVNGVEVATELFSGKSIGASSNPWYVGRQYSGQVDEVRIWNTTKNATQLQGAMNNCLTGDEANLALYFSFEDVDGSDVFEVANEGEAIMSADDIYQVSGSPIQCMSGCAVRMTDEVVGTVASIDTTVTLMGDQLITYDAVPVPLGTTFQWLDCENSSSPIVDAEDSFLEASTSGTFAVEITQGSCVDTSSCHQITIIGTQDEVTKTITVSPNPVVDAIQIMGTETIQAVTLINTHGFQRPMTLTNGNNVDVSELGKGIYFLQIQTAEKTHLAKFVKN